MGNESSSDGRNDNKVRRASNITRSSSLRVTRAQLNNNFMTKEIPLEKDDSLIFSTKFDKKRKVGRSNSFTPSSTYKRPTIRHANHKLHEDNDLNESYEISTVSRVAGDYKISDNRLKYLPVTDTTVDSSAVAEDDLFVPKKIVTPIPTPTPTDLLASNTALSTESQVTHKLKQNSKSEHKIESIQEETTSKNIENLGRIRSNSFDKNNINRQPQKYKADIVLESQNNPDSEKMILHQDKASLNQSLFNPTQREDVKTMSASGHQKRKMHSRSHSLGIVTSMMLPKTLCRVNSADEAVDEEEKANNGKDETDAGGITTQKRGAGRRISDSCLLKEEHIKRSQQFTEMLKQIQRRRSNPAHLQLSVYGLGAITEKNETEETRSKFCLERRNEYLNNWLKNQSERINTLSEAVKGDPEKISILRKSFRERSIRIPTKQLLPQRPSSAQLPRRNINVFHFSSLSSSESETDDITLAQLRNNNKNNNNDTSCLDQNENILPDVPVTKKNPLKKQLSDTLTRVDESFKNPKYEKPRKEAIRFSTLPTSSSFANGANNVAVVKPMVFSQEHSIKPGDNMIVNSVISAHYHAIPEKLIYTDPVDMYNDKEKILQEELGSVDGTLKTIIHQTKSSLIKKQASVEDSLEPVQKAVVLPEQYSADKNYPCEKDSIVVKVDEDEIISSEQERKSSKIEQSEENSCLHNQSAASSVNRITESLSKVMGDLKVLRQQDIKLARQLIGLGKSIKDFKHERKSQYLEDVIEQEDEGDV